MEFYFHEERFISAQDLGELFTALDWESARFGDRLGTIPERTLSLGAWEEETLVGYINAFSDGLNAYMQYFCVHPDFQRRGVGRVLMEKMTERLAGHERITLTAVEEALGFYIKAGFFIREGKFSLAFRDM